MTFNPAPLRQARRQRQLTLNEIGSLVGRSGGQMCRYEKGFARPDPFVLGRWLSALDLNPTDVFPRATP